MDIRINSIHFDHTPQLKDFIQKKVTKLDRYFDNILKVELFLKVVKPETTMNKHAEVKVSVPNSDFFAEKDADSFEEAVDMAVEALKKQLSKHKEKLRVK